VVILDGRILANSLVSLKGTDLRMVYALVCKTNMGHLLSSKTKDLFSKEEQDHFTKHLVEEVNKIENKEDQVLQVDLFLELTKLLKLRGIKYISQKEIEDQCTNIVNDLYRQYQKQDKHFRSFTENQSNSTKLQQMVTFQMSKVFNELDYRFQDFSITDQTKFASQVNEYIQSLPEDKQVKIKRKLGVDDLTDEMVRKAIATSGTSIVFASIVEVSGFAFYTTATSLLATFAGLLGLTLPFGFYTGLTSTIAVLANPLFIIPLLLGGDFFVNHQNRSLRKKLLPIIVMQIGLPYMSNGEDSISFDSFIQEWETRYHQYMNLHAELEKIEMKQNDVHNGINQNEKMIKEVSLQIADELEQIRIEKQRIQFALKASDLDQLDLVPSFNTHKSEYQEVKVKIRELKDAKKNSTVETSFFKQIGNKITNFTTSLDIRDEEKSLELIVEKMVKDVVRSTSSFKQTERENIIHSEKNINKLRVVKRTEEMEKGKFETILKNLKQEHHTYTQKIKQFEKENDGLEDLLITK